MGNRVHVHRNVVNNFGNDNALSLDTNSVLTLYGKTDNAYLKTA